MSYSFNGRCYVKFNNSALNSGLLSLDRSIWYSLHRSMFAWQPSQVELLIAAPYKCEVRAVTGFFYARILPFIDIYRQMIQVYDEESMPVEHVRKWHTKATSSYYRKVTKRTCWTSSSREMNCGCFITLPKQSSNLVCGVILVNHHHPSRALPKSEQSSHSSLVRWWQTSLT